LHGIGEFIRRLEKIAEECGEKKAKETEPKDEFLRLKQRVYALLEQARNDIHERQILLKKRGNCQESIQKGYNVRQNLDELKRSLPRLQELHKRAQGKRGAKDKKDELQARYQDIRVLKRHIDEINELFLSGHDVPTDASGAPSFGPQSASLLGLRDIARGTDPEDGRRNMTGEEEGALAAMKKRDGELDQQVGEIGKVIERLDPLAKQIGVTADRQRIRAEGLNTDVSKAEHDLESLNKRVTDIMKYEKNTNFCCQMVLGVSLLCCVGFIFQQVS
ncbi:unnamed protein product, partial [Polarella glacialis]